MTGPGNVTVKIFGHDYTLRAVGDEGYLVELARMVDSRMQEASTVGGESSPLHVAVLAALNLADELQRERQDRRAFGENVERTTLRLADEVARVRSEGV